MKHALRALVLIVCIIGVTATSHGAKKYDGQTMQVMVSISPRAADQVRELIAPKLKEKYGLDIAVEAVGAQEMLEKIVVMKNNPRVSIAGWDVPIGMRAAEMGLCAKIDGDKISHFKDMYDWSIIRYNNEVKVLTTSILGVGIIYNEDEFKKRSFAPPISWDDLWRKELAGRISISTPESTWGQSWLVTWAKMEGGGVDNIDPAFKKVKTLLPNIHTIHKWSSELVKLMQMGEVWMAITGSNISASLRSQGYPSRWVAPKEGAPMVNGGMSIVANAPYQDAAHDFLSLYFSPEFQAVRIRESGTVSALKIMWSKLSPKEIEVLPITEKDFSKLTQVDWIKIDQQRTAWTERWHKEIK
jgi:putative spermidine/putrescine transport system substrate-binding protein